MPHYYAMHQGIPGFVRRAGFRMKDEEFRRQKLEWARVI
jgi:hypothetical protein